MILEHFKCDNLVTIISISTFVDYQKNTQVKYLFLKKERTEIIFLERETELLLKINFFERYSPRRFSNVLHTVV